MVAQAPTVNPKCAALLRALDRAKAERLVAYPNADGSWSCKSYSLVVTGPRADDVQCDCIAGQKGQICKHLVCVAFCRKHGLRPLRPAAPVSASPTMPAEIVNGMDRNDPLWIAFN